MRIAINKDEVDQSVREVWKLMPDNPIMLDRFLENAIELDVDALCDGNEVFIAGVMQHIEPAGVHSGDSTAVLPPFSLSETVIKTIKQYTTEIALKLRLIGFINVQFGVQGETVYVIEANPRASRTVPFVAKSTGVAGRRHWNQIDLGREPFVVQRPGRAGIIARGICDERARFLVGEVSGGPQGIRT